MKNLFVYGSLNNSYHLQLITGRSLPIHPAILYEHRRIHPKSGYPFATPWSGSKIEGSLIYDIPPDALAKLDDYESEGKLYCREVVTAYTENDEPVPAYVYIGIPEALEPYFKKGFEKRDRIEAFIEKQINRLLEEKAARYLDYNYDPDLPLQVTRELLSEETHSLVREYFRETGLPAFILKHELEEAPIPDLEWIQYDPKAARYADEYMTLAVKFMVFNQLEERFRQNFRPRVKTPDEYYRHTVSAVMALKLLDTYYQPLKVAMRQLGADRYDPSFSYLDYTVAALLLAQEMYTDQRARDVCEWIRQNRQRGMTPIGAELEFSNIGWRAIGAQEHDDPKFDCFYYFYDFDLMRRGWKLGAHVDDHGFLTTTHTRTRGFLELAFGRYKLLGDVSKPATHDPWILAQLIELAIRYLGVKPHSLHVSIQTEKEIPFQEITEPEYWLCLLLLGGDFRMDKDGILREMRIHRKEIIREEEDVYFSRRNRHHSSPDDTSWHSVIEYQFPRLYFDYDYQPLLMALKGYQMALNPCPLITCRECPREDLHAELADFLIRWADHPTPVTEQTLNDFLHVVERGLDKEAARAGGKYGTYARRILAQIDEQLHTRNKRIRTYHDYS